MIIFPEIIKRTVFICFGKHCKSKGSEELAQYLEENLKKKKMDDMISIERGSCQHLHDYGPFLIIKPDKTLYIKITKDTIDEIIKTQLLENKILEKYLFINPLTEEMIFDFEEAQKIVKELKLLEKKNKT